MDLAERFIVDFGWVFFVTWGAVLAVVSLVAFGPDLIKVTQSKRRQTE